MYMFTYIQVLYKYSFSPHTALRGRYYYYAHFINEETKAWKSRAVFQSHKMKKN